MIRFCYKYSILAQNYLFILAQSRLGRGVVR